MIRYLIVELEGLRTGYSDSGKRPKRLEDSESRQVLEQKPPVVTRVGPELTISACCSSQGAEGLLGLVRTIP